MEVAYQGKVYELSVRHLPDKKPKAHYRKYGHSEIMPHSIDIDVCEGCGSAKISGVCMNSRCSY